MTIKFTNCEELKLHLEIEVVAFRLLLQCGQKYFYLQSVDTEEYIWKMESLESKVEQLCALIMRTDNENWDTKNKAIVQMTEMFLEQGDDVEVFTPNLFRALKEPVKLLVSTSNNKLFQFSNRLS